MSERTSHGVVESSAVCYDTLEQWARGRIQAQLQQLLEEEVPTFLGRVRHERRGTRSPVDPPAGGLRCDVHRWGEAKVRKWRERRESSAGEDRRLNPIYTPLDGDSHEQNSPTTICTEPDRNKVWQCRSVACARLIS